MVTEMELTTWEWLLVNMGYDFTREELRKELHKREQRSKSTPKHTQA